MKTFGFAALAAALATVAAVLGLAAICGGAVPAAAAGAPGCVTSGPLPGLASQAAATNARIVAATAEGAGGHAAAVIAVMVGYTESGLLILGNPTVDTGGLPTQGIGSDADSIGIFQQRASWGTVAQRLDPVASTQLFLRRLLADSGWQSKPAWVAAQDVQVSAYDGVPRAANHGSDVYGGNYEANAALAQRLVDEVESDAARLECGALSGGQPANPDPASHGLPAGYVLPPSANASEARVVAFAIAQLDKRYVFGAAGPDAYDCSGLTMAAWLQVGIELPHQAAAQALEGTPTSPTLLVPGDLVLVAGDDGTLAAPGHVGIYLGSALVLSAADPADGIRVQTFGDFVAAGHGLSALRHIA